LHGKPPEMRKPTGRGPWAETMTARGGDHWGRGRSSRAAGIGAGTGGSVGRPRAADWLTGSGVGRFFSGTSLYPAGTFTLYDPVGPLEVPPAGTMYMYSRPSCPGLPSYRLPMTNGSPASPMRPSKMP